MLDWTGSDPKKLKTGSNNQIQFEINDYKIITAGIWDLEVNVTVMI